MATALHQNHMRRGEDGGLHMGFPRLPTGDMSLAPLPLPLPCPVRGGLAEAGCLGMLAAIAKGPLKRRTTGFWTGTLRFDRPRSEKRR